MRKHVAVAAGVALAFGLAGCGEDRTEAQEKCVGLLEAKYGEAGVVDVGDFTENSSAYRTKVEGSLVYRGQQGAGERVDTWFACVLDEDGSLVSLDVK